MIFSTKYIEKSAGFTLLEIIVALALVATSVVLAIQLFSANLRAVAASEAYVRASANAGSIMRAVITDEDFPDNAAGSGTLDIYRYEISATKVDDEKYANLGVDMYRVDVALSWREGGRDKTVRLSAMKLVQKKI